MEPWQELAGEQDGVLGRAQASARGLPPSRFDRNVRRGLWQRLHPGVAAVHSGPVTPRARIWAAVLHAGPDALASHGTAAWLHGLVDTPPTPLHVSVPADRHPEPRPGLRIHRSRAVGARAAPRSPPRTGLEDTVLDLVDSATDARQVVDLVLRAGQRRLTTAARLAAAAAGRRRLRWRKLFDELVEEVRDGVASPLERRYVRDVEVAHGLPRGRRNRPEGPRGRRRFRDVDYRKFRLVVELDGLAAHPPDAGHLDRSRDREVRRLGRASLRFGWREVAGERCDTAWEVTLDLWAGGWTGRPVACGPRCPIPDRLRRGA